MLSSLYGLLQNPFIMVVVFYENCSRITIFNKETFDSHSGEITARMDFYTTYTDLSYIK